MNVAEWIMDAFVQHGGRHVFTVPGGHSQYLLEAADFHEDLEVVYVHHEQTAAMACEAYYRASGKMAMCLVTAGPGVMNCLTGVASAYLDGIPMLVVSGQVKRDDILGDLGSRPRWFPELPTTFLASWITVHSALLEDPRFAPYEIEMAFKKSDGPIWLDVPLDVQAIEL